MKYLLSRSWTAFVLAVCVPTITASAETQQQIETLRQQDTDAQVRSARQTGVTRLKHHKQDALSFPLMEEMAATLRVEKSATTAKTNKSAVPIAQDKADVSARKISEPAARLAESQAKDRADAEARFWLAFQAYQAGGDVQPSPELTQMTLDRRETVGARIFGWNALKTKDVETAIYWFGLAFVWSPSDDDARHGLALAQEQVGNITAVITLLQITNARLGRALQTYQASGEVLPTPELTQMTLDGRATGVARIFGWNALNAKDTESAIYWYDQASAWSPADRAQFKEAESSYLKALAIDPLNTSALSGLITLYRQQGMASKVHLTIVQLTPAQRDALGSSLKRIESTMFQDLAELRLAKGQNEQAIKYLEQAVKVDDDPSLHFKLANLYARRGQFDYGRMLLEGFLARHPNNAEALYIHAMYQSDRGDIDNALKALNRIEVDKRSPEMAALQQRLMIKSLGPNAKSMVQAGKKNDAIQMLSQAEANGKAEQMLAVAFAWAGIGEINRGRVLFDKVQASSPTPLMFDNLDSDDRSGLIKILDASGSHALALQQLDAWSAGNKTNDLKVGLHLSDLYADLGEYDRAHQQIDALLAAHPDDTYVLYDAWKMAKRSGNTDQEITYLKKLVIAEPEKLVITEAAVRPSTSQDAEAAQDNTQQLSALAYKNIGIGEFGSAEKIQRDWKVKKLAALIDRRARWISSAIDVRNRPGSAGLSEYHAVEIPLEYKTPWHMDDEVFFRADQIKLNAGSVAPTDRDFGSMLLCQPNCTAAPLSQTAEGTSFNAGYQRTNLSADIGTTPLNFPVSNIVGGIQYKGDLGQFGYSLEASRRSITGSVLSYAGSTDPNTGRVWGGVVASGGRLGLSLDKGETFGFWSTLGLHNLTGRNVQSNRRVQLMAGEQWRVINEENRKLVIGLTGMYWSFAENAGEYSFGHGGYYSPHTFHSLALPVTYAKRSPRFSYLLRAAITVSQSQAKEADLYPTDSALQALAKTRARSATFTGGPGNGSGYQLRGAWEYQIQPRLFIGGLLSIERSQDFEPNQVVLYLRYSLDGPGAQAVFLPPEPIEPSSQFY